MTADTIARLRKKVGKDGRERECTADAAVSLHPATPPEKARKAPWRRRHTWLAATAVVACSALTLQAVTLLLLQPDEQDISSGQGLRRGGDGRGRIPGPVHGIFPPGCRWRDIQYKGVKKEFWAVEEYEFWDVRRQRWTRQRPAACTVAGLKSPSNWTWRNDSPRTEADCRETHCVYDNLWYNNGRWYLLVDGPKSTMSRNQDLNPLHVADAAEFLRGIEWRVVSGDTLVFDFIYFLHPTAIGHWGEMLFPLFSILATEGRFRSPPQQVALLHLKRAHLMGWARALVAATLGVRPGGALPPLLMQEEVDSVWAQIPSRLEGLGAADWVCFEHALVVRDIFTGGTRTFLSQRDAQVFRARLYAHHGLAPPAPQRPMPRVITYQRKRANRRIVNEALFLGMLREFGEVRVVEFNESTPFDEQLAAMAATGVLVSVHTSSLANAPFLPPGAAVVEVLQRNWAWHNLDKSFQVQTEAVGDIHHFAWRARHRNQTVYLDKRDAERFGSWTRDQCSTEECIEAHTKVDVVVDLAQFRALLADRLPHVFAGASVAAAALPWPLP